MIETILNKDKYGWEWVDITGPTREELEQAAKLYGLHTTSLEDCLDHRHQPKFEIVDQKQFIILRTLEGVETKTDSVNVMTTKIAVFLGEGIILTVHRKKLALISSLKEKYVVRSCGFPNCESQVVFLFLLLREVIESYRPVADELETEIDELEKGMIVNRQTPSIIREIHWFRSRVSLIRRIFRQTYEVILKIEDENPDSPLLHDARERIERFLTLTEGLRETSNDILNTHLSLAAHRTNEVIRVLTIFSVFFLPLTFIVGIYGMNFVFMPELKWPLGYAWAWGVMVAITVVIYGWFKRKGWL